MALLADVLQNSLKEKISLYFLLIILLEVIEIQIAVIFSSEIEQKPGKHSVFSMLGKIMGAIIVFFFFETL